jgi:hypothetical protein
MTAQEAAFVARLQRRAHTVSAQLAARELQAYELIRQSLSQAELVRAIENGRLDRLITEVLDDTNLEPSIAKLRARVDQVLLDATRAEAINALPSAYRPVEFGVLNPLVSEAAQKLDTRVIQGIRDEIRESVRQAATEGLKEGVHPREVARRVRDAIGLAPNQERAVANFRRMLEQGDAEAFTRTLRDRRFDRTLRKAFDGDGLSAAQIDKMAETYRKRFIAHNAETHARTIALDAQKHAQGLAWEDAIRRGVVNAEDLVDTWVAVGGPGGDGRNRPEHLAMHGEQVPFGSPFSNGQMIPGETDYNCRCLRRTVVKRSAVSVAA